MKNPLANFFTNLNDNIFCLINLPEVIKGTLFSRYSRSSKNLRTLFQEEFLNNPELKNAIDFQEKKVDNRLDIKKAEDFYERVLVGYGDDSVAELGGAHIALENISVLATKSIEEHRLGLSPLEKSSRYVYFDKKIDGDYLFFKDKKILHSRYKRQYLKVNRYLFDTYSKIVHEIQPILRKIFPGDDSTAYQFSIRAKACDLARGLLPLSSLTNLGIFGNGRAFEYLITNLLNDPLEEVKEIALKMNDNLYQVIPAFIKRATNERGRLYREYLSQREKKIKKIIDSIKTKQASHHFYQPEVKLISYDKDAETKIIGAIIFERTGMDYQKALDKAKSLGEKTKKAILEGYLSGRLNRHHKPGRSLEEVYFSFEILADWGVYKDLMRHRILTRYRQIFTNKLGFWIPEEIKLTGFEKRYRLACEAALDLYQKLTPQFPYEAQYIVLHCAYNRFYLKMNLREAVHLCELRSSPQGHPAYRKIAQLIAQEIIKKYPLLGRVALKFVDFNDYQLERLTAFKKIEERAKKLDVKGFEE